MGAGRTLPRSDIMNPKRVLFGFIAGFLATLIFHQGALAALHASGATDHVPWDMSATKPLGVPAVISLAFWGGVWGILLVYYLSRVVGGYYLRAQIFGAIVPTLVAMFIIAPLKHTPIAFGGDLKLIAGAVILNGLWGLGTALLYGWFTGRRPAPRPA